MIVRIAGVNHFDPGGRQRLVGWLVSRSEKLGNPAFVATEWDEEIFATVKAQREEFQRRIRDQWPALPADLLKVLTLSLAYEGDAYAEVFPGIPVLWLDHGRQPPEDDVRNYAIDRFDMYKRWLGNAITDDDCSVTLGKMGENAIEEAGCPPAQGSQRDAKFANLILRQVAKNGEWAAIIVGKFHALRYPGSMLALLEENKQTCAVELL